MKKRMNNKFLHYFKLTIIWGLSLFFFGLVLGTIAHEVVGHGLTAIAFGNGLSEVTILNFQINSEGFSIVPLSGLLSGLYGSVNINKLVAPTIHSEIFFLIMASIFPLIIAIIFGFLLLLGKQKGFKKILFICFALWFLDPIAQYFIPYVIGMTGGHSDFGKIVSKLGFNIFPFVLIAIISAVIISGIIIYRLFNMNKQILKKILFYSLITLSLLLIGYIAYLIIFGNAIANGGVETCQKIKDFRRMEGCIFSVALANKDSSICQILSENKKIGECLAAIASNYKDISFCKEVILQEDKDTCFYKLADDMEDLSICDYISNKTYSEGCLIKKGFHHV